VRRAGPGEPAERDITGGSHFVDIASQAALLMPCPPRLIAFIDWPTDVTNHSIVQGASPGASYAVRTHGNRMPSPSPLYFGLSVLTPGRRKATVKDPGIVTKVGIAVVPHGPILRSPFRGYRCEGVSVRYSRGEGESRGRAAAGAPFTAPARQARGR
jgi:hypothetical protein